MGPSPPSRPEPSTPQGRPSGSEVGRSPSPPLLPPLPKEQPSAFKAQPGKPRSSTPDSAMFKSKPFRYRPRSYDAPTDARTRGTLQPGDIERIGVEMAEFIRSHHGYEEGWVGRKPLGQGAVGRAGMWEKRDADGNVVDVGVPRHTDSMIVLTPY